MKGESIDSKPIGTVLHFHGSDRNISLTAKNTVWLAKWIQRFCV